MFCDVRSALSAPNPYDPPADSEVPRREVSSEDAPQMFGIILTITFILVAFGAIFIGHGIWTVWFK